MEEHTPLINSAANLSAPRCRALAHWLQEREPFKRHLDYVIRQIRPDAVVVYGKASDVIFDKYRNSGIAIKQFESDFGLAHRRAVNR